MEDRVKKLINQHIKYRGRFYETAVWTSSKGHVYIDVITGMEMNKRDVENRIAAHLTKITNKILKLKESA